QDAERAVFRNEQTLHEEGLLGRAFSASYAPREPGQAAEFAAALRAVFARYQRQGEVVLRYETSVYLGRRRPNTPQEKRTSSSLGKLRQLKRKQTQQKRVAHVNSLWNAQRQLDL